MKYLIAMFVLLVLLLIQGCASVSDPRKADIFSWDKKKSEKYLQEKEAALEAMRAERRALSSRNAQLEKANAEKKKQVQSLQAALDSIKSDMAAMERRLDAANATSEEQRRQIQSYKSRISDLKGQVHDLDASGQQDGSGGLQGELDQMRKKRDKLMEEMEDFIILLN